MGKLSMVTVGWLGAVVFASCASTDAVETETAERPPVADLAAVSAQPESPQSLRPGAFEQLDVQAVGSESLRGLSVPSAGVVWVSGANGVVARTEDSGATWIDAGIAEAAADGLDLRCIVAFDAQSAWAASSGPGEASRLFHTTDGGSSWTTVMTNADPEGFFDGLAFWDRKNGILLGDPTDGYLTILVTADAGQTWERRGDAEVFALPAPPAVVVIDGDLSVGLTDQQREDAAAQGKAFSEEGDDLAAVGAMISQQEEMELILNPMGEYCFAASNQSIALKGRSTAWIGTGGKVARVFKTLDRGLNWTVASTPLRQEDEAAGVFALSFRDFKNGVAVGGMYTDADGSEGNCAVTSDGGATWNLVANPPAGYRSSVCDLAGADDVWMSVGTNGSSVADGSLGQDWGNFSELGRGGPAALNSVASDPKGQAFWVVGSGGFVARMPADVKEVVWD